MNMHSKIAWVCSWLDWCNGFPRFLPSWRGFLLRPHAAASAWWMLCAVKYRPNQRERNRLSHLSLDWADYATSSGHNAGRLQSNIPPAASSRGTGNWVLGRVCQHQLVRLLYTFLFCKLHNANSYPMHRTRQLDVYDLVNERWEEEGK